MHFVFFSYLFILYLLHTYEYEYWLVMIFGMFLYLQKYTRFIVCMFLYLQKYTTFIVCRENQSFTKKYNFLNFYSWFLYKAK